MARIGGNLMSLTAALAVTALGYGNWLFLNETIDTSGIAPQASEVTPVAADASSSEIKPVTLADLSETLTRPLFNATRRPANRSDDQVQSAPALGSAAGAAAPQLEPKAAVRLIGMMRGEGQVHQALLQSETGPASTWISVGGEFAGWRLTTIEDDSVTVEMAGARSVLPLHPVSAPAHTAE